MRIAIVGAHGQLGTALVSQLGDAAVPLTRADVDITNAESVAAALVSAEADVVINTAAWNFVDRAEDEPGQAFAVNAIGPRNLAAWCCANDARLVHVSSDYVFGLDDARVAPYRESDLPGPVSVYAASKLAGEHLVAAACAESCIVRTCGLYGRTESGKGNFVDTMLRLGREREEVRVVSDQHCTPTSAQDLAAAIIRLIHADCRGLFHVTNSGGTTWHEMAVEIFRIAGLDTAVRAITTAEYGAPARRPAYSVLDTTKYQQATGHALPDWKDALARYLAGHE
ncbi:MAG: dTDP-4-dehydrorhamnose reductase [Planctomycetota bacterium]|nr:MAG: dTDP-4-dehydrorhamnose reductase [Planctomycetota bacterium]REK27303.1 MAG: dTDP-4-dehydrorhamnose reductase [Planctomycetota bacterium]REK36676.1 MAG: dTDP-4-dehydrorhamnose reductase [Planctomycetota bacterium]